MPTRITLSPGQRFAARDTPRLTWEVVKTYDGTDGIAYVQLRCVQDPSRLKTVAVSALAVKSLWRFVPDARVRD